MKTKQPKQREPKTSRSFTLTVTNMSRIADFAKEKHMNLSQALDVVIKKFFETENDIPVGQVTYVPCECGANYSSRLPKCPQCGKETGEIE